MHKNRVVNQLKAYKKKFFQPFHACKVLEAFDSDKSIFQSLIIELWRIFFSYKLFYSLLEIKSLRDNVRLLIYVHNMQELMKHS